MKFALFFTLVVFTSTCHAEPAGHWSAGVGANYGGPGVKFSLGISENIELYANAGLPTLFALLSYRTGSIASAGAEYAFTNNQHHTLNFAYAALHHKDDEPKWNPDERKYEEDVTNLSGTVIGYTYYFSGLKSKGQALGVAAVHLSEKKDIQPMQIVGNEDLKSLSISWGYRF